MDAGETRGLGHTAAERRDKHGNPGVFLSCRAQSGVAPYWLSLVNHAAEAGLGQDTLLPPRCFSPDEQAGCRALPPWEAYPNPPDTWISSAEGAGPLVIRNQSMGNSCVYFQRASLSLLAAGGDCSSLSSLDSDVLRAALF